MNVCQKGSFNLADAIICVPLSPTKHGSFTLSKKSLLAKALPQMLKDSTVDGCRGTALSYRLLNLAEAGHVKDGLHCRSPCLALQA